MFICVHLFSLPSRLNSDKTCLQCLFCYFISAVYIQYWGLFGEISVVPPTPKHNCNHPDWYHHHHHHQELFWWMWCGDQCLDLSRMLQMLRMLRMLQRQKPRVVPQPNPVKVKGSRRNRDPSWSYISYKINECHGPLTIMATTNSEPSTLYISVPCLSVIWDDHHRNPDNNPRGLWRMEFLYQINLMHTMAILCKFNSYF